MVAAIRGRSRTPASRAGAFYGFQNFHFVAVRIGDEGHPAGRRERGVRALLQHVQMTLGLTDRQGGYQPVARTVIELLPLLFERGAMGSSVPVLR